jgi:hypothetical protein
MRLAVPRETMQHTILLLARSLVRYLVLAYNKAWVMQ